MRENLWRLVPLATELLARVRITHPEIPPPPRFSEVYKQTLEGLGYKGPESVPVSVPPPHPTPPQVPHKEKIGVACLPCSNDHFSTTAASLQEAVRLAKDYPITDPEISKRIALAEDEMNIMERLDLTPGNIQMLEPSEQELAREAIKRARNIRHKLPHITNAKDLERVATEAQDARLWFRGSLTAPSLGSREVSKVVDLAKRVASGEISKEQARKELRKMHSGNPNSTDESIVPEYLLKKYPWLKGTPYEIWRHFWEFPAEPVLPLGIMPHAVELYMEIDAKNLLAVEKQHLWKEKILDEFHRGLLSEEEKDWLLGWEFKERA